MNSRVTPNAPMQPRTRTPRVRRRHTLQAENALEALQVENIRLRDANAFLVERNIHLTKVNNRLREQLEEERHA